MLCRSCGTTLESLPYSHAKVFTFFTFSIFRPYKYDNSDALSKKPTATCLQAAPVKDSPSSPAEFASCPSLHCRSHGSHSNEVKQQQSAVMDFPLPHTEHSSATLHSLVQCVYLWLMDCFSTKMWDERADVLPHNKLCVTKHSKKWACISEINYEKKYNWQRTATIDAE